MPNDEDKKRCQQQERNRLILATFLTFCLGFLFSMALGALPLPTVTTSHEWVAVIVSTLAACISGYAVYLVNETLRATREMSLHQKDATEAAVTPWVFIESIDHATDGNTPVTRGLTYRVRFKNYGKTPARDFNHEIYFGIEKAPISRDRSLFLPSNNTTNVIPPGEALDGYIDGVRLTSEKGKKSVLIVCWNYRDEKKTYPFETQVFIESDGIFRPVIERDYMEISAKVQIFTSRGSLQT